MKVGVLFSGIQPYAYYIGLSDVILARPDIQFPEMNIIPLIINTIEMGSL